jgi:hypothetical protein
MEAIYKKHSTIEDTGCLLLNDNGLPRRPVSGQIDIVLLTRPPGTLSSVSSLFLPHQASWLDTSLRKSVSKKFYC